MKKNIVLLLTLSITGTLLFTGCGGGSSETSDPTTPNIKITITDDYQVESLGAANTINATVSLGNTSKDLYLVLSNYATTSASSTITHNTKVIDEKAQFKSILPANFEQKPVILHAPKYVQEFNKNLKTLLQKKRAIEYQAKTLNVTKRAKDVANSSTASFCVNINKDGNCIDYDVATARSVVNVSTEFRDKTLNIWVEDDSFDSGSGCENSKCVTQDMVNELAETFLKDGADNDIYDWVTNIYGEEWEDDTNDYSGFIPANDEITILLTDIDGDDSPTGGVIGFFWAKDNFENSDDGNGSNERVMFYADSVMFANTDDGDFWQKEMYSTLAHEFQHMIHFYQKTILLAEANTDTWINEMLSETTEDLIATKIQHIGPRGIDYTDGSDGATGNTDGRYPIFNANNTLSLTAPFGSLADYSKVNAFGAYLIRNYGGAKLLYDIMHNTYTDEQAVVDAVNKSVKGSGKTFDNLLSEWGVAVMLSDHDNLVDTPEYNTGWFTDNTYNGTTYEMGSINFFNYDPLPTIHTSAGTVQAQGNYYYKIGANLTGDITINLELNGQTEATLIAK